MKRQLPLAIFCFGLFMVLIMGGQVMVEPQKLAGGFGTLLAAILSGSEAPTLSHAIVFTIFAIAGCFAVLQRKVFQVPNTTLAIPFILFFTLVGASLAQAQIKTLALISIMEWFDYGIILFLAITIVGRQRGILAALGAIYAGCLALSVAGIREYSEMRVIDPTWRIFASWQQPNALAGILAVGFVIGLGLMAVQKKNIYALLIGLLNAELAFGLMLTQSKGGILVLVLGSVVYMATSLAWIRPVKLAGRAVAQTAACLVIVIAMTAALQVRQSRPATPATAPVALLENGKSGFLPRPGEALDGGGGGLSDDGRGFSIKGKTVKGGFSQANPNFILTQDQAPATAFSRFSASSHTAEQSFTFRKLLWKSSVDIIKGDFAGIGMANFRLFSARSGLTTQTHLAHETWLQLGAEASPIAPLALLLGIGIWAWRLGKDHKTATPENLALRAACLGGVILTVCHGFIESNLYTFGHGIVFFALLGLGVQLSTDSSSPEFTPMKSRFFVGVTLVFVGVYQLFSGYGEALRARTIFELQNQKLSGASEGLDTLLKLYPKDAENWYLKARTQEDPKDRLVSLTTAASLAPWPRILRAKAREEANEKDFTSAEVTLNQALRFDPNNMPALLYLAQVQTARELNTDAEATLRRLIAVEQTPYYQTRSIPQLIPTETFDARLILAQTAKTDKEKIDLLTQVVKGYREYMINTVPQVKNMAAGGASYGGETMETARQKMEIGRRAADDLSKLLQRAGDAAGAKDTAAVEAEFKAAEDDLAPSNSA